jgi:hypothetical protein
MLLFVINTAIYAISIKFNNTITKTDFGEREVVLFFRICERNSAKEIRANKPAFRPSKILNATVFEGVLKLTSLSNSEFFGNISGILITMGIREISTEPLQNHVRPHIRIYLPFWNRMQTG